MKKILSLLALMMLTMTSAWAGEATFDLGTKNGVSTPEGFFKSVGEKWNWNNKFSGAEYDGISFSQGLKMEGSTKIGFTTTAVSTVTIVQSTWSAATITLDDAELAVDGATDGTGCRIYTIENVAAGDHVIGRGSGESGLFYVKVEWNDIQSVTFINDAEWEKVFVWAWNDTENFTGGTWPGMEMTSNGDGTYSWETMGNPTFIVFSDGGNNQTSDLEFKNGGVYKSTGRVITLTTYSATFKTDGMTSVWAYVWNGDEKALGDWPGTQMTADNDNTWKIEITTEDAPKFIIFHDNAGNQTPDWAFEDGKAYEYMLKDYAVTFKTDAGWGSVNAYAWSDGTKTKEFLGEWPGTQMIPANEINNGFGISFKAFNAPEQIIFNNGDGEQTANLPFVNEKAYKWITATPYYALKEGDTFAAGTTVDLGDATITYGVDGGAEFGAAAAAVNEDYAGFAFMTGGNGENGTATSGTVYTIVPKYDGTITIGVRLNGGKAMHINEDGTDLADYAGIKIANAANTTFDFAVKAGSTYKIWCDGSKLGFFGFDYKFTKSAERTISDGTYYVMNANEGLLFSKNGLDKEGAPLTFTFDETTGSYTVTGNELFETAKWVVEGDVFYTISTVMENTKMYLTVEGINGGVVPTVKTDVNDASLWVFLPQSYWEDEVLSYNVAGTADLCGTEWDVNANKMTKNIEAGVYEWKAENVIVSQYHKPEFKIAVNNTFDDGETVAWYPEGDNWQINTDVTGEEGVFNVTITFNNVTKEITVSTEKTGEIPVKPYTVYFENNGNWAKVYAYAWYVAPEPLIGEAILTSAWPGDEMTQDPETGKFAITIESKLEPTYIVFNNGEDGEALIQTEDLEFEDGKTYSYEIPAEDIYVLVSDGDIAAALADAKAKVAKVGNITIELNPESNAIFTISSSITVPNSLTIWGNDQKIDASALEAPFIAMENVEAPTEWKECNIEIAGVKVTGLKQPLFFSTCKNYLIKDFNVSSVNCELAGDVTAFDFTKGSVAVNFNVVHSTFYAPTATTKSFYSSQSGQKATEAGDYTQTFTFTSNTMYNLAPTKNFFSHRQSNQTWLAYNVQNNIFVNCGKSGQTIKGMNGGASGKNPTWTIIGNVFNFDGADTSAAEETGDTDEPVQNSVAGVVTFVDAANGDFNGEIQLAEGAEYPAAIPGAPMWNINIKAIPGFYLVGSMNDWTPSSEFMMAPNDAVQPEDPEYMITLDLKAGALFKVVSVAENGAWTWYPYGEDCSVENEGNYTIYCRPNGNDEWTWKYVYAQYNGEPTGINGIVAEKLNNATIYNLNGQRVQNAQKGLYIINGRKVVVK